MAMIRSRSLFLNKRGFTLTEVLLAVAIIGIITPAVLMLMVQTMRGFTGYEAAMQLRITNQATLNRIYLRLGSCKRIFSATDTTYVSCLGSLTGAPAKLSGSALPTINDTGSLAYGTTNFAAADVGNCLFFANNDSMPTLLSGTSTVKVDVYRFNFYYLSTANSKPISAAPCYSIVEWQSVQFADYNQIMAVTPGNRQQSTITALYNQKIYYSWDATQTTATSAFYNLTVGGNITAAGGGNAFSLPMYRYTPLTTMMTGVIIGGFSYGVASNSAKWTGAIQCPKTIPEYAIASGFFPGGFEVAIAGQSSGRSGLIRSVLVAQGSMPSVIGDDLETVAMARDVW